MMQNLIIEQTNSTLYINFDATTGILQIKGESFPENVAKSYKPAMEWMKEYLREGSGKITLEFEIIYFNSSTSKLFMSIFDLLEEAFKKGREIVVNWHCSAGNETAIECGEDFEEDLDSLPFNIIIKD